MNRRVLIREHQISDIDSYVEWQTDPRIATHLSWLPRTLEEARLNLQNAVLQQSALRRSQYFFAVVLMESNEVIGDVGFTTDDQHRGNCGWFIRYDFQGFGYATESVRLMIARAFDTFDMKELTASCRKSNTKSNRVMDKCGFRLVKENDNRAWYILTKNEWKNA